MTAVAAPITAQTVFWLPLVAGYWLFMASLSFQLKRRCIKSPLHRMTKLKMTLGLLLCLAGTRPAAAQATLKTDPAAARRAIVQVLTTQTAAWNRGDIPGFMQGYWHSDSLVFIGRKGPTYGWQPTLANYQKNYPTAATMGQLDFSSLRVSLLAPGAAQVVGHWHLARPAALGFAGLLPAGAAAGGREVGGGGRPHELGSKRGHLSS